MSRYGMRSLFISLDGFGTSESPQQFWPRVYLPAKMRSNISRRKTSNFEVPIPFGTAYGRNAKECIRIVQRPSHSKPACGRIAHRSGARL